MQVNPDPALTLIGIRIRLGFLLEINCGSRSGGLVLTEIRIQRRFFKGNRLRLQIQVLTFFFIREKFVYAQKGSGLDHAKEPKIKLTQK